MMQTAPDIISIFEKLGTPVAFVVLGTGIFLKVLWPWWTKRQDKLDEIRVADAARVASVLDEQVKWSRAREDTILRELTQTLQHFSKSSERTEENVRQVLEELRRK